MDKFYNKKEILLKAQKIYSSGKFYRDYIEDGNLFPLEIKLKILKESNLRENFSILLSELSSLKKENLELCYREFNFKSIGKQKLPIAVNFRDAESFLKYIFKFDEFELFKNSYKKIVTKYSCLKEIIVKKPFLVLESIDIWDELFLVCDFFINNPKPNIYVRELSISGVDTKFIERNKKVLDMLLSTLLDIGSLDGSVSSLSNFGFEKKYFLKYPIPLVRFRILDDAQKLCGLSDLCVTIEEFKELTLAIENIFIIENKITTLSFPALKNSMVIFGSGYGVESIKDVKWLNSKKLFYWGDIDRDGFAILSQARAYFKHLRSIFMDEQTIESFAIYSTKDSDKYKRELPNLVSDELVVYDKLQNDYYGTDFRLEQEKIHFDYVMERLNDYTF